MFPSMEILLDLVNFFSLCFRHCVITFSLLLNTAYASSRSLPTPHETTVLNVASSLQQTQHILSTSLTTTRFKFESTIHHVSPQLSVSTISTASLLRVLDILVASQYEVYKTLVVSQLERDSSGLAEIIAKARLSIHVWIDPISIHEISASTSCSKVEIYTAIELYWRLEDL